MIIRTICLVAALVIGASILPARAQEVSANETPTALTGELLAAIVGPVAVPLLDQGSLDRAAASYFRNLAYAIKMGRPPEELPLPAEVIVAELPEVLASEYRDQIRAFLSTEAVPLPVLVSIDQQILPGYDEMTGLRYSPLAEEDSFGKTDPNAVLDGLRLSTRDLPVYRALPLSQSWREGGEPQMREALLSGQGLGIVTELDRIMVLPPVPMDIRLAADHGLVGNPGPDPRKDVILRWDILITEVRAEDRSIVVTAALRRLNLRWAEDDEPIAELPVADFPTVAGLRAAIAAALPPLAGTENLVAAPSGAFFGAEMADLLQVRYLPGSVDDRLMKRMFITRFAYEAAVGGAGAVWGSFFRDLSNWPTWEELDARLPEFRAWTEARANAIPDVLTLTLPLQTGPGGRTAIFENGARDDAFWRYCRPDAGAGRRAQSEEKEAVLARICAYLDDAWNQPLAHLYLSDHRGGLRGSCSGHAQDRYCDGIYNANGALKIPEAERPLDIVHLDRLPVLDPSVRGMTGNLDVELMIRPVGVTVSDSWPATIWDEALQAANAMDDKYSGDWSSPGSPREPARELMIFQATTVSARLVDRDSGAVISGLALVAPVAPPAAMLEMPAAEPGKYDLLGVTLGMSFDEAEAIIRGHMDVAKVLVADRSRQMSSQTGDLKPYTSGRMYLSADSGELIAIFDEPPAMPGKVLGIWRILRLPQGQVDPAGLRASLAERYGEPGEILEVNLPFMQKGLGFIWRDQQHERCTMNDFDLQPDIWMDETGTTSWLPPFMIQPYYPVFAYPDSFLGVGGRPLPEGDFCPLLLTARYATYDGKNHGQPAGDEIVTWLSDNRAYRQHFYDSLAMPAATSEPGEAGAKIKF